MARESSITYEQVAAAADAIKGQGGKPTTRTIRDTLGTGGMATVLKFFQQWQAGQVRQSQAIDDTLDPAISRAISNHIALRVQEATADATVRLADLQAEADTIIAENERQASELESITADRAELLDKYHALCGTVTQMETDARRTAEELTAERQAAEAARVELAKATLRLEAVPRIEAEADRLRGELDTERQARTAAEQSGAVLAGALEYEKTLREKAELHLIEHVRMVEDANKRAVANAEALGNERVAVQAANARLEAAARELTDARAAVASAREAARTAGEEAAELRGRLAAADVPGATGKAKPAAKAAAKPKAGK